MLYLMSVILLVAVCAIVVLFAMVGELASRLESSVTKASVLSAKPDLYVGASPVRWPEDLGLIGSASASVLVVLSTICASCEIVANRIGQMVLTYDGAFIGVALSTGDAERARQFRIEHGLDTFPCYTDVNGDWVRTSFNVRSSPTLLVFNRGILSGGFDLMDASQIAEALDTISEGMVPS